METLLSYEVVGGGERLRRDVDGNRAGAFRLHRNRLAGNLQALDVTGDRFPRAFDTLVDIFSLSNATGKGRNGYGEAPLVDIWLKDNGVRPHRIPYDPLRDSQLYSLPRLDQLGKSNTTILAGTTRPGEKSRWEERNPPDSPM